MKIQAIDIFRADLPMKEPLISTFYGSVMTIDQARDVVVKVTSDDGHIGYGASTQVPAYHGMTQDMILAACRHLAPLVVGKNPNDLALVHDLMDWAIVRADAAKCAIDMALFDLLGKATGQPAYALMGGRRRDAFPTTWTLATGDTSGTWTDEQTAAEARRRYDMGYRGFEVHIGSVPGAGFERDLARIATIKEACPDVAIDADAHRNWSVKEAVLAIRALERYQVWVEQPCETMRQLAEVRASVTAGIIADESCQNVQDLVEIINLRAADAICLKPIKAGGLYKCWQMATLAERFGLAVRVDGIPGESILSNTASAHVAMTLKQPIVCGVMQHARLEHDFVTAGGLQYQDGKVTLPDSPGLGCEVDESVLVNVARFD
jgi:L-alanine-DL-glutamate epimerase-like enolase superfamily enzyme